MPDSTDQPNLPPPAPKSLRLLTILLSLCVILYLADGLVSLADDSLILVLNIHLLGLLRGLVTLCSLLVALVVYVTMGITPRVPKRVFLPLTLSYLAGEMILVFLLIYFHSWIGPFVWLVSLCQVVFGFIVLFWLSRGNVFRWPLVGADQIEGKAFSWWNLSAFLLGNIFILLPGCVVCLAVLAATAVSHFSEGFVALRPAGISLQMRKYVRGDGKTIQLFPMAHVADEAFYQKVSQSFPTNSIVLLEGVSDKRHLITNKISYKRLAASLGLQEQHEDFKPTRGQLVNADVDVDHFGSNTVALLNLVMLVHDNGFSDVTAMKLSEYSPQPDVFDRVLDDLLGLRNRHLAQEIQNHLAQSDCIIVPWGAAHMPGISREIEKSGFHLTETHDYMAIRFRHPKRAGVEAKP